MTEQPEVPQEEVVETEQVQPVSQEPQAPFPPKKQGMRFFVKLDDLPSAKTYQQPLSLHRFEDREGQLVLERFDKNERKWVWNAATIAFTGLGGDESFKEIDEEEANRLIAMWTPDDGQAEAADAEPVPEEGADSMPDAIREIENKDELLAEAKQVPMREQTGEDQSDLLFDFLENLDAEVAEETAEPQEEEEKPEADKTVGERKQEMSEEEDEEEIERTFSLRGLLRRILNI